MPNFSPNVEPVFVGQNKGVPLAGFQVYPYVNLLKSSPVESHLKNTPKGHQFLE